MAAPANTFVSSSAVGNREDLANMIYRITPTVTPFMTSAARATATNTIHEWQTQDLASAVTNNAQAEGDDATNKVVTPTVRIANRTQISTKTVQVSGTQRSINTAGRNDEMGYQMSLAALEIRRDMESSACQLDVIGTAPRQSRGLRGWVVDNVSTGVGYVAPSSYTGVGVVVTTDGAQRAFTEALMKSVLQLQYTAGGEPDTVMMGPASKQTFSSFTGNATRFDKSEDAKLYSSIDVYVSDFGEIKAVPNRFQRARDVFILESQKWAFAYLRPFSTVDLAKTGDADRKEIIVEWTVEARAPKANGAVYDVL